MTLERGNAFTPVASATMMWPWGTALGGGAVGGIAFFLLNSFSVSSGLAAGVFFFTLIGGAVALLGKKGDRRAKRWAAQYPWKFAGAPALAGALGVAAVALVFGGGLFGAIGSGLLTAAVLWVILGVIGTVAGGRS
ncbi:hypothetical protein J0910_02350 [Nocardiopsis sp. CNT-189]|uniref:hypothetical protein n=1 Tax=Nocardiopsis TaxID=2013 RepID=UPI00034DB8B6|nr:hypothetical protein [Nocardiopsis potens]